MNTSLKVKLENIPGAEEALVDARVANKTVFFGGNMNGVWAHSCRFYLNEATGSVFVTNPDGIEGLPKKRSDLPTGPDIALRFIGEGRYNLRGHPEDTTNRIDLLPFTC